MEGTRSGYCESTLNMTLIWTVDQEVPVPVILTVEQGEFIL